MGMYTGLKADLWLDPNMPKDVFEVLGWMVEGAHEDRPSVSELGHSLFDKRRWPMLFKCQSAYFDHHSPPSLQGYERAFRLQVNSSLKNYEGEIQAFINWIYPHVINGAVAYRYEEAEQWTKVDFHAPPDWAPGDLRAPRGKHPAELQIRQDLISGDVTGMNLN